LIKLGTPILRANACYIEPVCKLGLQTDLRIKGTSGITGL